MSSLMMTIASNSLPYEHYRQAAERSGGLPVRFVDRFLPVMVRQVAAVARRASAALREARIRRRTLSDLGRMDAHLLADIGLRPEQVRAVADGLLSAEAATESGEPV